MSEALTAAADIVADAPDTDLVDAVRQACGYDDPSAQVALNALAAHLGHPDGDHAQLRQWQRQNTPEHVVTQLRAAAE